MSLNQSSQTTDCTFIEYWNKSGGDIICNHRQQFKDERNTVSKQSEATLSSIQIRTLQQKDGDQSCGYYSIFFISKLSQIFQHLSSSSKTTKTTDSILSLMKDLRSKEA
eukprot:133789_1